MKKYTLILALSLATLFGNAQASAWQWAKKAGGITGDIGFAIAIDTNGNSYVTGFFQSSSITFGSTTLTNSGSYDMFIVKYDASGNVVWAKSTGGSDLDEGRSIAVDGNGNSYVTGYFQSSSISFGSTILTNSSAGTADMFIVKYDASGTVVWAKRAGGSSIDEGFGIAVDGSGNSYVTGWLGSSSITFGSTTLTNAGNSDMFIVKYNTSGTVLWAKRAGGSDYDNGTSIAVDGSGNSYITGGFNSSSITFGGTTLTNDTTNGSSDIFIVKYDASGVLVWAKSAGGSSADEGKSIAVDANGNSYVTGNFASSIISFGSTSLTFAGVYDIFIVKFDASGTAVWAKKAGGSGTDFGKGIALDTSGNCYVTGSFGSSTITFGSFILTNAGSSGDDMFIVKYDTSGTTVWAKKAGSTGSDWGNGIALDRIGNTYVTGQFNSPSITFGSTTLNDAGSADMFIVKLCQMAIPTITASGSATFCQGNSITLTASSATSYLWSDGTTTTQGIPISTSGNYSVIATNSNGCSITSTATNVTVLPTLNSSQTPTICSSDKITIGTHTYNANGTYTDVLTSIISGCDSIVTTYLTVDSVNTSITVLNSTLTANETSATYQWLNCNNGNATIAGQTNQNFTATTNGSYAVIVTKNNCSDTSSCNNITITGIIENGFAKTINIYPNPFTLKTTITFIQEQKNTTLKIMDVLGKEIKSISFEGKQLTIEKGEMKSGIYFLQINDDNKNVVNRKIVLQ